MGFFDFFKQSNINQGIEEYKMTAGAVLLDVRTCLLYTSPAGTAAIIGGACSLIGSTSQLAANSVLQGYAGYEEGMGMFDMTKIMFPAAVVQIIFWGLRNS